MEVTTLSAANTVTKMGEIIVPASIELTFNQRKQPLNNCCKDKCLHGLDEMLTR